MNYSWPGNVRELRSAFEYAFVTCRESIIQPHHLPPSIIKTKRDACTAKPSSISRKELKKKRLLEALEQAGGNQSEAAKILGVSRVTIWNQMKHFGVNVRRKIDRVRDS